MAEGQEKNFNVSWDQLHRDTKALSWRLAEKGPWQRVVAIARGGLVPAAIVARELNIRLIDTVCIASYDHMSQGDITVLDTNGAVSDRLKTNGMRPTNIAFRHEGQSAVVTDLGLCELEELTMPCGGLALNAPGITQD